MSTQAQWFNFLRQREAQQAAKRRGHLLWRVRRTNAQSTQEGVRYFVGETPMPKLRPGSHYRVEQLDLVTGEVSAEWTAWGKMATRVTHRNSAA